MRNVFDQYDQVENKLSHALASCLHEEPALLRRFIRWILPQESVKGKRFHIVEQSVPGRESKTPPEEKRLPDIWIYDDDDWCLLIESKVAAKVELNQLLGHLGRARSKGFVKIALLVIGSRARAPGVPANIHYRQWSEVYSWLSREGHRSKWAQRMKEYLEVAEVRMASDEYNLEGTLTRFSGIPFGREPYDYRQGKRILKLAMEALRHRKNLKVLGPDPERRGRSAITGQGAGAVWDFIPLKKLGKESAFTKCPHLTLAIQRERVVTIVTLPNALDQKLRRRITGNGFEEFRSVLKRVLKAHKKHLGAVPGADPYLELLQRRYPSQRATPFIDAKLEFDLRTAFPDSRIKHQPEWLRAVYDVLKRKKSNLQLAIEVVFPYRTCVQIGTERAIDLIAKGWLSCRPLLDAVLR